MGSIVTHPISHSNEWVLTSNQLAELYGTDILRIQQNYQANKNRYIPGKHFFLLEGEELKRFKDLLGNSYLVGKRAPSLYLWTKKGALYHAKSLGTDEAWEMYERLVDEYFELKEKAENQQLPVYFNQQTQDRCRKNAELLPEGYWCVENEMVSQALVLQALQKELQHWCLPSGSGGKKWIQHLRSIDHPLLADSGKYPLLVPNLPYLHKIMIYPYALLDYFRRWLRVEYAEYYETRYLPGRKKGYIQRS